VILYTPRVLELGVGRLEPLARLCPILTRTDKCDDSLRVKASCVVYGLEEDVVQSIYDHTMLWSGGWDLVDRFESQLRALARKLGTNLIPQPIHLLFYHSHICRCLREVCPRRGVMMDVDYCVKSPRYGHVNHI
jgi:hypothetical protein